MTQVAAPIHRRHLSSLTTEASGIQRVCVVGAGTLGAQVAVQTALRGFEVSVLDVSQESLDRCQEAHRAIAKQYVTRDASPASQARGWRGLSSPSVPAAKVAADALDRLSYTTSFEEALRACDLVSENVPEVPDIKASTYASLHEHAPKGTIFTTNSSTLLPSQFAKDTGRPHHFCALHFANGIWDANIGEVMPHSGTSEETVRTVLRFAKEIGMVPFHVRKEQNGYLINTLLVPWLNASLTLAQRGVSVPADVDRAWLISTGGCNAPPGSVLGPFQTMDIIGLTTVAHVMDYWGDQLGDAQMIANGKFVKDRYLEKGKLGITNGNPREDAAEGFYSYPNPPFLRDDFLD